MPVFLYLFPDVTRTITIIRGSAWCTTLCNHPADPHTQPCHLLGAHGSGQERPSTTEKSDCLVLWKIRVLTPGCIFNWMIIITFSAFQTPSVLLQALPVPTTLWSLFLEQGTQEGALFPFSLPVLPFSPTPQYCSVSSNSTLRLEDRIKVLALVKVM